MSRIRADIYLLASLLLATGQSAVAQQDFSNVEIIPYHVAGSV